MEPTLAGHLDDVIAFARCPLTRDAYVAHAHAMKLRCVNEPLEPGYVLIRGRGYSVMMDANIPMARVHAVGLFDETDGLDSNGADVDVVTNVTALDAAFEALKMRLTERLGSPTDTGAWEQPMMHDRRVHRFGYSVWPLDASLLVLLENDEGDAHIGEWATVELRIIPRDRAGELPESAKSPVFGWPVG